MAFNPFYGWTREDLENELRAAQEDLAAGKAVTKATAGDTSTESRSDASAMERIKMLLKALNRLAPDDYPIADVTAIDRTRIVFSAWGVTIPIASQ